MKKTIITILLLSSSFAFAEEAFDCPEGATKHVIQLPLGTTKYFCLKGSSPHQRVNTGPMLYTKNGEKFTRCEFKDGSLVEGCEYFENKANRKGR